MSTRAKNETTLDPLMKSDIAWTAFFNDFIEGKINKPILSYQMQNEDDYLFLRWLLLLRVLPTMPGNWPATINRLNKWYDEIIQYKYDCGIQNIPESKTRVSSNTMYAGDIPMLKNSIRSDTVLLMNRYPEPMKSTSNVIGATLFVLCTHFGVDYSSSSLRIALLLVKLYDRVIASHKDELINEDKEKIKKKQENAITVLENLIPNGVDGLSEALYNYIKSMTFQRGLLAAIIIATHISFGSVYSTDNVYTILGNNNIVQDFDLIERKHKLYVEMTENALENAFKVVNPNIGSKFRKYGLLKPYINEIDTIDVFKVTEEENAEEEDLDKCENKKLIQNNVENEKSKKQPITTPEVVRLELLHNWRLKMFINIIGDSSITVVWTALFAANIPSKPFLSNLDYYEEKNNIKLLDATEKKAKDFFEKLEGTKFDCEECDKKDNDKEPENIVKQNDIEEEKRVNNNDDDSREAKVDEIEHKCIKCYGIIFCCCKNCSLAEKDKLQYPYICKPNKLDFKSTFWAAMLSYLIGDIIESINSIETLRIIMQTDLIMRTNGLTREEILTILGSVARKTATTFTIIYPTQNGTISSQTKKPTVNLQVYNSGKISSTYTIQRQTIERGAANKQNNEEGILCTLTNTNLNEEPEHFINENSNCINENEKSDVVSITRPTDSAINLSLKEKEGEIKSEMDNSINLYPNNSNNNITDIVSGKVGSGEFSVNKKDTPRARRASMRITKKEMNTMNGRVKLTKHDMLQRLLAMRRFHTLLGIKLSELVQSLQMNLISVVALSKEESTTQEEVTEKDNNSETEINQMNDKTKKAINTVENLISEELNIENLANDSNRNRNEETNDITQTLLSPDLKENNATKSKAEDAIKQLSSDIYDLRQIKDILFNILPSNETLMNDLDENQNCINSSRYKTTTIDGIPTKKIATNDNFVAAINEYTQLCESAEIKRKKIQELEKTMADLMAGINRFK